MGFEKSENESDDVLYVDFDGTLTGINGEEAFKTRFPHELQYATTYEERKNYLGRHPLEKHFQITETAEKFLKNIIAHHPTIKIVIVSRNYENYIRALLEQKGIETTNIRIYDQYVADQGKEIAVKDFEYGVKAGRRFVFDDSSNDYSAMKTELEKNPKNIVSGAQEKPNEFDWPQYEEAIKNFVKIEAAVAKPLQEEAKFSRSEEVEVSDKVQIGSLSVTHDEKNQKHILLYDNETEKNEITNFLSKISNNNSPIRPTANRGNTGWFAINEETYQNLIKLSQTTKNSTVTQPSALKIGNETTKEPSIDDFIKVNPRASVFSFGLSEELFGGKHLITYENSDQRDNALKELEKYKEGYSSSGTNGIIVNLNLLEQLTNSKKETIENYKTYLQDNFKEKWQAYDKDNKGHIARISKRFIDGKITFASAANFFNTDLKSIELNSGQNLNTDLKAELEILTTRERSGKTQTPPALEASNSSKSIKHKLLELIKPRDTAKHQKPKNDPKP